MICRICKQEELPDNRMVKYGVRHYAHHACFLKAKGAAGFALLKEWQLRNFPYKVAQDAGMLSALNDALGKHIVAAQR